PGYGVAAETPGAATHAPPLVRALARQPGPAAAGCARSVHRAPAGLEPARRRGAGAGMLGRGGRSGDRRPCRTVVAAGRGPARDGRIDRMGDPVADGPGPDTGEDR